MRKLTYIITLLTALLLGAATDGYAQSTGPVIKGNVYGGGENAKVVVLYTYDEYKALSGNESVTEEQFATLDFEKKIKPLQVETSVIVNNGEVYGDIYGGGALADVEGNTSVTIDEVSETQKGKFAGSVFGGGMGKEDGTAYANVKGNTSVKVKGGEIIWKKAWDATLGEMKEWDADTAFFFTGKFLQRHNIYAGGNYACTVGTWNAEGTALSDATTGKSSLTMTRGLLGSDLLNSLEWKEAFAQHEDPHFYAFGGGYGIFTKAHKSDVNICLPMAGDESASGGNIQLVRPHRAPGSNTELDLDIITDNYGVAWTTVLGILGGGYNGHVVETNVLVGDATYAHRVYGGGLGSYEGWAQSSAKGAPNTSDAIGYVGTTGKLPLTTAPAADLQTTHVTIAGGHIHGDVFGGGAGVAPRKLDAVNYTDFTEIARVKGNTKVETTSYKTYLTSLGSDGTDILNSHPNKESDKEDNPLQQRAQVFGNVYGGGDVANVTGNTNVSLFGGDVFGYTFGAGLGRLVTEANDYTLIGNVSGNSLVEITDTVKWTGTALAANYIEPTYKPTAWDDIYGGGRNGVTNGDAMVNINGGKVGDNIFGGGLGNVDVDANDNTIQYITSADVKGNTTVNVNGGSYQWREIADINGNKKQFIDKETITQSELLSRMGFEAKLEPVKDFFKYRTLRYTRDHSIYGGGNVACNVGTYSTNDKTTTATLGGKATVNMNHGLFADKDIMFTDAEEFNIATLCRYLACENSENTQFGVFGGGYGANTKVSETKVNLNMGLASDNDKKLWAEYFGVIQNWYKDLSDDDKKNLYGGSTGENAYNRYFTARMAKSINVPNHTVLTAAGGGLAGYVAGNTTVTMTGHSGALRVYGGGIGMKPEGIDALTDVAAAALTYGQVGGDTKVDVQAGVVVKNVYGGGAGVESQRKTDDSYVDFPGMAHVLGKTDVTVGGYSPGTVVFGKVYGGGDVANVGTTPVTSPAVVADPTGSDLASVQTKVTIDGGCVFQQVFAGGSGRTKGICNDYTKLGAVYGNTQLVINNSTYTAEQAAAANLAGTLVDGWTNKNEGDTNEPWLWDIVYGGGQNGTVFGNTDVQILGGNLGYDIFGGGWGNKTASSVLGVDDITSADVTQNTNVRIAGGKWCLSQSWDGIERHWNAANVRGSNTYSSQYDPDAKKFSINHNVYGGGNVACTVGTYDDASGVAQNESGKAYVYVTKGMLVDNAPLGHDYTNPGNLFAQPEWENIYEKHASPHFSVFGAGYGVDTKVDNTFVKVDMGTEIPNIAPSATSVAEKEAYEKLETLQSLMDVIGGGYEGKVNNTCHVDIDGYTFMRNIFGGAYYAAVGNTEVNIVRANMDNVYGGGMMGDVINDVKVTVGTEGNNVAAVNKNLIINHDVYGANDVSGYVGAKSKENGEIEITPESKGVKINLYGGHIHGSVYGGGNGNYLYLIDEDVAKVTVEDDYQITDDDKSTVYKVPLRASDFPSLSAMSDQQKMVNVISYRPSTMKVDIDFKGNSTTDRLLVDGNIFGGGNSATITDFDGEKDKYEASVKMNIGSHIKLGGVFLGSDGEALFESKNNYMTFFPLINNLQLYEHIDWETAENQNIPIKFLPTPMEKRPEIYKNNIDLYFMPVEMAIMPEVTWNGKNSSISTAEGGAMNPSFVYSNPGIEDAEIGTFCCGGNRGNMDTDTKFHINFPEDLTITDKIVGGCNNANYTRDIWDPNTETLNTLDHTGGFLLGSHGVGTGRTPQIHLTLRNKFKITEKQTIDGVEYYAQKGNVFGGCYDRGVVRGDILVEVFSNMLNSGRDASGNICGLDSVLLRRTTDKGFTVASVYGAGFGPETTVRGDTEVRLGDETQNSVTTWGNNGIYNMGSTASSCNYIFGGGRQGNVIGNTNVQIRNGRVGGCVVGASYAGTLNGSAQTMIGFPELYYRAKVSRGYDILRADEDPVHAKYKDDKGNILIQKRVYYTKGDLVTATAYNGIRDKIVEKLRKDNTSMTKAEALTAAETELRNYFDKEHSIPANNDWSKINIQIDKAVYGGGYALATGSGSYTVMKYTDEKKFLDNDIINTYGFNGSDGWNNSHTPTATDFTKYGGNTFVIVGDVSENYDEVAETATDFSATGGHTALNVVPAEQKDRDHIKLSSSQLIKLNLNVGDDLFGLFKELTKAEANPTKYDEDGGWEDSSHPERVAEGKELSGQFMKITTEAVYTSEDKRNNSEYFEFKGEGGIYGDGRLSISEGFRICDVIGYGYNGSTPKSPSLMNCIHRFDIARFKDCCISLLGDRDYTSVEGSAANAVEYSMARVAEIQMESAIPQNRNYIDLRNVTGPEAKHSRNYVGLSSAQFDLSAVKSNDVFSSDDSEAAPYHNSSGILISSDMVIEGTEDDGAKKFTGEWSYYNVKKWYLNEYNADRNIENSDYYDDANAQVRNEKQFQLRNSATARNMFGIFSGYALNVHSTHYDENKVAQPYYGPVIGVFEVDLIGTRAGEAGGYAYAQNIHTEPAKDSEGADMKDTEGNYIHSFLESSGNFVFPATEVRKVVDNCTPIAYNSTGRDGAEGHYWYVTGFKYYYNATITGYTYDGKTRYFESDNSTTKRLVLSGTKANQMVELKNFHWLPRHADPYYATVDEYNAAWGTQLTEAEFKALPEEKRTRCDIEHYYLTTAYQGGDGTNLDANKTKWQSILDAENRKDSPFYNLSLSLDEYGKYTEGTTKPYLALMPQDTYTWSSENKDERYKIYADQHEKLSTKTDMSNPMLGLRLVDCMDNNGKDENGDSYYSKHLYDPCVAKIVLTTPAVNDNGDPMWSAYAQVILTSVINDTRSKDEYEKDPYYILSPNGDYMKVSLDEARVLAGKNVNVFEVQKAVYDPVSNGAEYKEGTTYYKQSEGNYVDANIADADDYTNNTVPLFTLKTPAAHQEHYVYDITLTIKYIKGPSYEGHIDIKNCALPGEMIRLSHENLKVESDETSLPHNGSFWTIGPGKKVLNDPLDKSKGYHWELLDETGTKERDAIDAMGMPIKYYSNDPETKNFYYPYNPYVNDPLDEFYKKDVERLQEKAVSPIMRNGVYHDFVRTDKPDYFIPAYYFMNGYVAQYSFTVSGIDEVFTTTIHPEDTLLVHNYHRMVKAGNDINPDAADDIKLSHAMVAHSNVIGIDAPGLTEDQKTEMTVEWQNVHKRPRVYIQDVTDFKAFAEYLKRISNTTQSIPVRPAVADDAEHDLPAYSAETATYYRRYATVYGKDVEFFLMNDIDISSLNWTAVDFKGTLHGNGHVITGLAANESLFKVNEGHIYNLGLHTGKIAANETPDLYHCCYTYNTGDNVHRVYRMKNASDGSDVVTTYTDDDWRTGRVAYDLNEFYLAERLDRHEDSDDDHLHTGYVENLYADGEYRFSRYSRDGVSSSEYLRNDATPEYQWGQGFDQNIIENPDQVSNHYFGYDAENHVLSHQVDNARAHYDVSDPANPVLDEYRPLIDEAKVNSAVELTTKRNDYIFFGQTVNDASYTNALGTVGSNLPDVVSASSRTTAQGAVGSYEGVTHNVDDQTNRVWRAYGFYHSKVDDAFHFNRAAWALHPELTAIDFTGLHDEASTTSDPDRIPWAASKAAASGVNADIFYPKMMDMPEKLTSFNVGNQDYVTKNLLVYTDAKATAPATDQSATAVAANNRVNYDESTAESSILGHWIQRLDADDANSNLYAGKYLHLVERATSTPGAGKTDGYSNDFNAPIAFSVTDRAWYERQPMGYRNVSAKMWEGLSLPFTATKVTAVLQSGSTGEANGEISHFYGDSHLHHEYWLRGITAVNDDKDKATFSRPGTSATASSSNSDGATLFTNAGHALQESGQYLYKNNYFAELSNYDKNAGYGDWYDQAANEGKLNENYVYLTKNVPYIVAFPGNDYYEFSMEGDEMYTGHDLSLVESHRKDGNHQFAVFEASEANIGISDDRDSISVVNGSTLQHIGTFMHKDDATYAMTSDGEAFDDDSHAVVPFRTYMAAASSSPVKGETRGVIYIVEGGMEGPEPENEDIDNTERVSIKVNGLRVTVENTYSEEKEIRVHLAGGQLVLIHQAPNGVSHFTLPYSGLFLINNTKVMARQK